MSSFQKEMFAFVMQKKKILLARLEFVLTIFGPPLVLFKAPLPSVGATLRVF